MKKTQPEAEMNAIAIYRQDDLAARAQRDSELARLTAAQPRTAAVAQTYERRFARVAAGAVLTGGGVLLWVGTALVDIFSTVHQTAVSWLGILLIPATWVLAALAWLGARAWAHRAAAPYHAPLAASDDPWRDLVALHAYPAIEPLAQELRRLERASLALPLIGISLLAPISIHEFIAMCFGAGIDFAGWIGASAIVAGPAHIALVICAWSHANALSQRRRPTLQGWGALVVTTCVSLVPFGVLMMVPPLIVFATGVLFVPALWRHVRLTHDRERAATDPAYDPTDTDLRTA